MALIKRTLTYSQTEIESLYCSDRIPLCRLFLVEEDFWQDRKAIADVLARGTYPFAGMVIRNDDRRGRGVWFY